MAVQNRAAPFANPDFDPDHACVPIRSSHRGHLRAGTARVALHPAARIGVTERLLHGQYLVPARDAPVCALGVSGMIQCVQHMDPCSPYLKQEISAE